MPRKAQAPVLQDDLTTSLELLPLADLRPHSRNDGQHPPDEIAHLKASLTEHGVYRNVVVAQDGTILAGHGVVQAAHELGHTHIAGKRMPYGPDDPQALKVLVGDNHIARLRMQDDAQLLALLEELGRDDPLALLGTGFDEASLAALAEAQGLGGGGGTEHAGRDVELQIDRAEELREEWGTEEGQLWACGEHRVICGDCTDKAVVEYLMDGQLAQMIFTDPPYGVDYDGGMKKQPLLTNDHRGTDIYGRALPLFASVVDDEAPLYLWYADAHAAAAAAAAAGYVIVAQIIWAKNHAQFVSSAHYHGKHEPCFYGHKKNRTARWYGAGNEVTLWEYDRSPSNDFHPTQKPVLVVERAIENSTSRAHVVLDGFLGGGTTLIACENLGRVCYGCEISPGYVAVTLQRWADLTGETPQRLT